MKPKSARVNGLEVSVCGVHELEDFTDREITHVVSIWDGNEVTSEEPRQHIRSIFPSAQTQFAFFHDLTTDPSATYAPSLDAVREILAFTTALSVKDRLLVHCAMGISRSTAIALATLCHHAGPGNEVACFRALKVIRPVAMPNPMMVKFADTILERNGAMAKAILTREEADYAGFGQALRQVFSGGQGTQPKHR